MRNIINVFNFGWPYLKKYQARLLAGILVGMLLGLTNASFIWAVHTLFERLDPQSVRVVKPSDKIPSFVRAKVAELHQAANEAMDPWIPVKDRPLHWQQICGGILFLPILALLRGIMSYLAGYCTGWVSERVIADLRVDVLCKLNSLSLNYFNQSTIGDMITRVNGDTGTLHRCLMYGFGDLIQQPFTVIFAIGALMMVSFKLTVMAFIFLPLCVIPIAVLGKKTRRASKGNVNASVDQSSLLVEMLSGIRVVKAFDLEQRQIDRFRHLSNQVVHYNVKTVQARELINPIMEVISAIGLGLLLVYIFHTGIGSADIVSFLTGVIFCYSPLKKLASLHVTLQQASVSVDRLLHIMKEQPSVKEPPQPKALPGFSQAVDFQNVSFSYGDKLVLQNINLTIPLGLKLGLAGESGSGKSTLVNLIFRFYDSTQGAIKIDGLDLRDVSTAQLHQCMALVSQEIVLFDLSVAENIALGKQGATRPEIEAAAKAAYAHDFINQLPQGYDTRIGERGVTLSGGQRQRLAIARAFVRNAPILVLDEATASLDSQSEMEVQVAIDRLTENRTVISVAHRLATLANMDRIIVLRQGRIVEQGGYKELIQSGGIFSDMARRQGIMP